MSVEEIDPVSDGNGHTVAAVGPIELRENTDSERETAYLVKSPNMKRRIVEAKNRREGIGFDEARKKLGL